MKPKQVVKVAVDAAMTLGLLFLMGYQFWGDAAHEWAGAGMFALFLAHHLLNLGWWKNLFRGSYPPARILTLVIDMLTLCAMLGLMVSGVMLSRQVFTFLPIRGGASFARLLHMVSAYWGFVLIALHLGLHWGMFLRKGRRAAGLRAPSKTRATALNLLGGAVAVYGLTAFVRRELLTYMLLQTQFVYLDFAEPRLLFYADYLAIMGLFIFLAHWGAKRLKPKGAST